MNSLIYESCLLSDTHLNRNLRPYFQVIKYQYNQLTLKCTTPTPLVLNASPDVTTP